MSIHVVAVDDQTGEREEVDVPDGDYLLICVQPSHLTNKQMHANGTHVLTIKGNQCASVPSPPPLDFRAALVDAAEKFIAAAHTFDRPEDAIARNVALRMAERCEAGAREIAAASVPSPEARK